MLVSGAQAKASGDLSLSRAVLSGRVQERVALGQFFAVLRIIFGPDNAYLRDEITGSGSAPSGRRKMRDATVNAERHRRP